jgi:tRNA(fMet)-specific endonuclease VapC
MVIADTSAWVDFIKRPNEGVGAIVRDLMRDGEIVLVGVARAEILRGLREPEWTRVDSLLDSLPYLEMTSAAWRRAGRIAMELAANGMVTPMTDVFIAALAIEGDHEVLTRDRHFERIPGLRLYSPDKEAPDA